MFSDTTVKLIVEAANKAGIKPTRLLAVVECETNGSPFEADGKTPRFLYERHVAYRHARAAGQSWLKAFVSAGLAIPKWNRTTQYKDQATSAMRLALISRARSIHEEIANASASWGLGQSMGENGPELGFSSATALVDYMTRGGLPAQLDVLIREIKSKRLITALNEGNFTYFAERYNGPGYKKNAYDTRMAAADKRWGRKLDTVVARGTPPAYQSFSRDRLAEVQRKLAAKGYKMVGKPDGEWGPNTVAAVNAFQHYEGLPETGDLDAATLEALATAEDRVQAPARITATADDLRGRSRTIDAADGINTAGVVKAATGATLVVGGGAEQLLGSAQDTVDKIGQAKTIWQTVHGWLEPIVSNPTTILVGIALVVAGIYVSRYAKRVIAARLDDFHSGVHSGSGS